MSNPKRPSEVTEENIIKEVLLYYPKTIRVLLNRRVPASCAHATIAEAARVAGVVPAILLADLQEAITQSQPSRTPSGRR